MADVRPATLVNPEAGIALEGDAARFVSRGGDKLDGALDRLDVPVSDRAWLDAGASTGGFTDCLLKRGARAVVAVDVGYGQLAWNLRTDDRVTILERTNARTLSPEDIPFSPQGVVADLSFISLTLVLPALVRLAEQDADFVVLVKPQFEVGRSGVGKGGVVRDPQLWTASMQKVAATGAELGLGVAGAVPSPLLGPAGNREFFLHMRRGAEHGRALEGAVAEVSRAL